MKESLRNAYYRLVPEETRKYLYKWRHLEEYRKKRTVVYPSEKGDFSLRNFDRYNCIFVHIPKTAGTSVAKSLFGELPYHYTASDYRLIYGRRTFDAYFKFAFVRNPWDRVLSAYKYLKNGGWDEKDRAWAEANIAQYAEFDAFVCEWLRPENIMKRLHFVPQYRFICNRHRAIQLDYLGYFETLQSDYEYIRDRLDIQSELQHVNVSTRTGYQEYYDKTTRDIVAEIYRTDIDMFGYTFDGISKRRILE